MKEVLPVIAQVFTKCSEWFMQILTEVDGLVVWSTAVLVALSYKFLLKPVFGYAGSDFARKSYNAFKRGKEK